MHRPPAAWTRSVNSRMRKLKMPVSSGLVMISAAVRGESAARQMFALPDSATAASTAACADMLVFSLISLAILPDAGRAALLALAFAHQRKRVRLFDLDPQHSLTDWMNAIRWDDPLHENVWSAPVTLKGLPAAVDAMRHMPSSDVAIIDTPWNGVWQSMKIASAAEAFEVNVAPHNFYGHLCSMMNVRVLKNIFATTNPSLTSSAWTMHLN